jgi:glutamate--cysteine ligase
VPLEGEDGVAALIDRLAATEPWVGERTGPEIGPWEYFLDSGGRLTFEPGAQVEHSTAVFDTAAEALDDIQLVSDRLRAEFRARGAVLAAAGIDLWHDLDEVPQQLRAGRYTSMAGYYDALGPWGAVMMRQTASLQVNLDLGPEGVWQERWWLANLMSPLLTAIFACSPDGDMVCSRARAWQGLDPSRTGFPSALAPGTGDPRATWAEGALAGNVMLIHSPSGEANPVEPGLTFTDWIARGHPLHGWPIQEDVDYHLTTLFFEVRPRGFLELRAGEALPDRWRTALVVLVTAVLYDDRARVRALQQLDGMRDRLPELWGRAAVSGVRDPELGELAGELWRIALEGASRLPDGYLGDGAVSVAREFVQRYTAAGRMPADELAELDAEDPARALSWTSE